MRNYGPGVWAGVAIAAVAGALLGCRSLIGDRPDDPAAVVAAADRGSTSACRSFRDLGATVSVDVAPGCLLCSASRAAAAADNDLSSAARLVVNGAIGQPSVWIRATAPSGTLLPARSTAGAYYSVPAGTAQTYSVTINTLLASEIQESRETGGRDRADHAIRFAGITTTKPFDAVEVVISNFQAELEPTFEIFELCAQHKP